MNDNNYNCDDNNTLFYSKGNLYKNFISNEEKLNKFKRFKKINNFMKFLKKRV